MKCSPDIKLLAKGILLGLGSILLLGVIGVVLSLIGASLNEDDAIYELALDATIGIIFLGLLSVVAVGVWVGLKASKNGWLLGGITTLVVWSVPSATSVVTDGFQESLTEFALGACLAGLSMLSSYIGARIRKRQDSRNSP